MKILFVNYDFLSAGTVFKEGLEYAAKELGIDYKSEFWNNKALPEIAQRFKPDLVFVVHGRKFYHHWQHNQWWKKYNNALWSLDDPYELDDVKRWSQHFDNIYVCDPTTVVHHREGRNTYFLGTCYNPDVHYDYTHERQYKVGFIGGFNSARQQFLDKLCERDLLSYAIGGKWNSRAINRVNSLSGTSLRKVSPRKTAEFYRETQIIINVWRTRHHYNKQGIPATALNPRVYESIACGAVCLSEERPQCREFFPDMPTFPVGNWNAAIGIIYYLLDEPEKLEETKQNCMRDLTGHTYTDRLKKVLQYSVHGKGKTKK